MSKGISWKTVLSMTPLGLVFAALTISGSIHGVSDTKRVIVVLLVIIGLVVGLLVPERPFRNGFVAAFLTAMVAIETQALFLTTYFANNPGYADLEMPFDLPPRVVTAVGAPLNALLAGLIAGSLAWICWKIVRALSGTGPVPPASGEVGEPS